MKLTVSGHKASVHTLGVFCKILVKSFCSLQTILSKRFRKHTTRSYSCKDTASQSMVPGAGNESANGVVSRANLAKLKKKTETYLMNDQEYQLRTKLM